MQLLWVLWAAFMLSTAAASLQDKNIRYWSGRPQAIGIDLSPSYIHVAQYDASSGDFTALSSIVPPQRYAEFMYELYQRQTLNEENHLRAYAAFARWDWLRGVVHATRWTKWLADWVPQLQRTEDFRFAFNTDVDVPVDRPSEGWFWSGWPSAGLSAWWTGRQTENAHDAGRSFNSSAMVNVLVAVLHDIKDEFLKAHNVSIRSAVIAKPRWVFNELDRLIDEACLRADIELLDKMPRHEAAMKIALEEGKTEPLVLEQCGYDFNLQKRSSSMGRPDLSAGWIVARLTKEMFDGSKFATDPTSQMLRDASTKLMDEVARSRNLLKYGYAATPQVLAQQEMPVTIPNFGDTAFTFTSSLPGKNISRVEKDYTTAIKQAVESMMLKADELHEYQRESQTGTSDGADDPDALREALLVIAQTVPHPLRLSGGSWWQPMDSLLVLADFPDADLIIRGAMRALHSIPELDCAAISAPVFRNYELAARGAALDAGRYIEYWEMEETWRTCSEDERDPRCRSDSDWSGHEESLETEHHEL